MNRTCFATLALCLTTLTACNGDPEPTFEDPTETPSTSSAAASPTPEPKSPRAQERVFLSEYWETVQGAALNGDPAPFLALSDPACQSCNAFARNIRDAYRDGGHVEGVDWRVSIADHVRLADGRSMWRIEVDSTEQVWFNGAGAVVRTVPAGVNHYQIELSGRGQRMRVADFAFIEP